MGGAGNAHQKTVYAQCHTGTVGQPGLQGMEKTTINGWDRLSLFPPAFQVGLKSQPLFLVIPQFVKTVCQLHAVEVELETLRHRGFSLPYPGQGCLTGRIVVDKAHTPVQFGLDAVAHQQIEPGIPVRKSKDRCALDTLTYCHPPQLLRSYQVRIKIQKILEKPAVAYPLYSTETGQDEMDQRLHFIHQSMMIVARTVPLEEGELRVVEAPCLPVPETHTVRLSGPGAIDQPKKDRLEVTV